MSPWAITKGRLSIKITKQHWVKKTTRYSAVTTQTTTCCPTQKWKVSS